MTSLRPRRSGGPLSRCVRPSRPSKESGQLIQHLGALSNTAILLCAVTGCGVDRTPAHSTLRDSAGVMIVETTEEDWPDGDSWQIDPQPVVTIGEAEGASEYNLFRVRGALRLDDGTIVVADAGNARIRFFNQDGHHIRSVGQRGEGPGDYQGIGLLGRCGRDSLVVWDAPRRRGTVLGSDGGFGRVFSIPSLGVGFVFIFDSWDDGSLLGVAVKGIMADSAQTGIQRVNALYFRFGLAGQVDSIGRFFDGESFVSSRYGLDVISMPFGFRAVRAAHGTDLYYGNSKTYEIRILSTEGDLKRVIRLMKPLRPLSDEQIDRYVERQLASETDPDRIRRMRALYEEVPFHDVLPAYGNLEVDTEGNLWVADYALAGESVTSWRVFDKEGTMLGKIDAPSELTIFEIGADYILGKSVDSLGIERVVLLRLRK